jgi:uncharacterized protein
MDIQPRLIVLQPTTYCNIDCRYCYLGRRDLRLGMSNAVVEAVVAKIISRLDRPERSSVVWHGGEPTAAGLNWFRAAYDILAPAIASGLRCAIQTNGIAIDGEWLDFFADTGTSIGFSIDGPRHVHDSKRRSRAGSGTWDLAVRGLRRAADRGFRPNVISVVTAEAIHEADAFYEFYRAQGVTDVSLSVDEMEGSNARSSYHGMDLKRLMSDFIVRLLERAWDDNYPLRIKEVERIGSVLTGTPCFNEQTEAWGTLTVSAEGNVSTFSPELMEEEPASYGSFVFGNVLRDGPADWVRNAGFLNFFRDVTAGLASCKASCSYFHVCGGGAPVNKVSEHGSAMANETSYCRMTTQAAADALGRFVLNRKKNKAGANETIQSVES